MSYTSIGGATAIYIPIELFWESVSSGKCYAGQFGNNDSNNTFSNVILDKKTLSTHEENNDLNFEFLNNDSTKDDKKWVTFNDVALWEKHLTIRISNGKEPMFSQNGDEENGIMSWKDFLDKYGKVKFYLDNSKVAKESCYVSYKGENIKSKNGTANLIYIKMAYGYKGEKYTDTFTNTEGKNLPEEITIKMGGKTLVAGTDYEWNSETGELTINEITGNVDIDMTDSQ